MASSLPEANLTRARELGKYSHATESQNMNGRPDDKSRSLTVEEVDIIRKCGGCGKNMRKVKNRFVCSCKKAIHCSKECLKSSKHRCGELHDVENMASEAQVSTEEVVWTDISAEFDEVMNACLQRHWADRNAGKGPSSDKVAWLKNVTRGDQKRILRYAESGNPTAAYVVGSAYADRQFDRRSIFTIPTMYKDGSIAETNEIAVKWLKVAAEAGIPEAMFLLFSKLTENCGLKVDRRVAEYWLDQAHATGKMEYLSRILETSRGGCCFPTELHDIYTQIQVEAKADYFAGPTLEHLLLAARFLEIKAWGGKTAMGEPFYGWDSFNAIVESLREIDHDQSKPCYIRGEKKTLRFISARRGHSELIDKFTSHKREENNLKFKQGVKSPVNQDFKLVCQTSKLVGRTRYRISCKHDGVQSEMSMCRAKLGVKYGLSKSVVDNYKSAGDCVGCAEDARQRLRAVSLGLFSLSLTPVLDETLYAARYANEDGIIVQDVFGAYSKPCMRQMLQCLMSNPADLHPLAVAEDANIFWPIIWFWGSVYEAVEDTCSKTTLEAIYHSLGDKIAGSPGVKNAASQGDKSSDSQGHKSSASQCDKKKTKSGHASAMAAFPADAAGEWRIACGNDYCPRVDHEVKFSLCAGCGIRRYCDPTCQKKDWPKHSKFCKANNNNG